MQWTWLCYLDSVIKNKHGTTSKNRLEHKKMEP